MKLTIIKGVEIALDEMEFSVIRAQGPGGQHVNKSATAVQLRFDIKKHRCPIFIKENFSL